MLGHNPDAKSHSEFTSGMGGNSYPPLLHSNIISYIVLLITNCKKFLKNKNFRSHDREES